MQSIEEFFIKGLQKSGVCAKLDDDVHTFGFDAFGDSRRWIVALDGFCEDIHFKRSWFSVYEATQKAFLVNISDIIAKNALPKYALLSLVIPRDFTSENIQEIINATKTMCQKFAIQIVGGDNMCGNRLEFHICIFGQAKRVIPRVVKQKGLSIFCTQDRIHGLGESFRTLKYLLANKDFSNTNFKRHTLYRDNLDSMRVHINRFLYPTLRVAFMKRFGKNIKASMDLSDGLLQDVIKLLGGYGMRYSSFLRSMSMGKQKWRLQSGEEYEILFAISPKQKIALHRILKICRIGVLEVGKVTRGKIKTHTKKWH